MKEIIRLLAQSANVAFSMYSAIPMPQIEWSKENMKDALCFFPLVGVVEGLILLAWVWLCGILNIGSALFAAVAVAIPIAVSGGIHLDGFCDTVDALSSRQTRERKLEILKDPHTGAFAVMACVIYLLLTFALWQEATGWERGTLFAIGFVLSRALSGLSVVCFPCAKSSGLAATFSDSAAKARVRVVLILYIFACAVGLLIFSPVRGAAMLIAAAAVFLYYKRLSIKEFGGITGDLAGYFLQINEIVLLAVLIL